MNDEIDRLKEERMEELQNQEDDESVDQDEVIRQQAAKFLTKDARERLGNIRAADPEKASMLEQQIANLGMAGQIRKIDDDQLKDILKKASDENDNDIKFRR